MSVTTGKTGTTEFSRPRIAKAARMRQAGAGITEIANHFMVDPRTVWRWTHTAIWKDNCSLKENRRPNRRRK